MLLPESFVLPHPGASFDEQLPDGFRPALAPGLPTCRDEFGILGRRPGRSFYPGCRTGRGGLRAARVLGIAILVLVAFLFGFLARLWFSLLVGCVRVVFVVRVFDGRVRREPLAENLHTPLWVGGEQAVGHGQP